MPSTRPSRRRLGLVLAFLAIVLTGTGVWLQVGSGPALVVAGLMSWISIGGSAVVSWFKN